MALSGVIEKKFHGNSYGGYYIGIDWRVNSQSAASNSSNITATVYIRTSGNGFSISSSAVKDVSVTIDGAKYLSTCTVGIGTNQRKNLLTKTVNVGHNSDGNKTCPLACALDINVTLGGTYYGKVTHSGDAYLDRIILNQPPQLSGGVNVSPGGTIPENQGSLALSWSGAYDPNGNLSGYKVQRYINGSANGTYWPGGNSFTDDISGFGQGTSINYKVWAYDSNGEYSGEIGSGIVTKNRFTGAWFNGHSNDLVWDSTSVTLSITGASNTNGNSSFKYLVYSDDVTIYNQREITTTSETVTIWKSGNLPAGPYIKFDDLKNRFRSSNFNGRLHVGLRTTNAYGTQTWSSGSIGVDLRVAPTKPTSVAINGGTALKTIATTGNKYYIPNGSDTIIVNWAGGEDRLGEPHKYRLYQILDGVVTDLAVVDGTVKSYSLVLPKQSVTRTLAIGVHTLTSYGYTDFRDSSAVTLHFYNPPTVEVSKVDRTDTTATASLALKANTSIPNVNFPTRSYTGASSGTLQNTQNSQNITATGLSGGNKYTWTVTIKDDTGLYTSNVTRTIEIPAYTPLFSVREKGVGVNAIPDGSAGLIVNKGLKVDGTYLTATRNFGKRRFTVGGDANTYYPVLLSPFGANTGFATSFISISRGYNWQAPDTWNTATHRGGLTLTFSWAGDGTWGGNSRVYNVLEFSETYTNMTAGMLNTTSGFIVWLRGGGALYQIDNDYGQLVSVSVNLGDFTASDKQVYSPRTSIANVQTEIMPYYAIRGNQLFANNKKVLTADSYSDNVTRDRVAYIKPDGVMEVGRYIDFHFEDGTDYTGRLSVASNGNLICEKALEASYLTVTGGGRLQVNGTDKNLLAGTDGADCYITNSKAGTYLQLKDNGHLDYTGRIYLSGYAPSLHNSYLTIETSKDGNDNGDGNTHFGYNGGNGYSHYFRGSGSVNIDCHGGLNTWKASTRYLQSPSGQNIDIEATSGQMYFNVFSATGCGIIIDRRWGGTQGSEACILNNKGPGWGFIGNSDHAFYRIYGTGGSVSQRKRKYDIHKFDNQYLYDQLKMLNTYAYRTISGEVDEDGNDKKVYRSDMQLGCMIEELPTEAVLYDDEGGKGEAVDIYAYATMILGATKVLQEKVESLEEEIENKDKQINDLETRLKRLEEMVLNGTN